MSAMGLAEQLRRIRMVKDVSLRDVEKATSISNAYLSQLESGNATNPSPHILYKLAEFYGVPYTSLMKTAGYLEETKETENTSPSLASIQTLLMAAKLTEEETEMVADYIEYLRSRQKKGKPGAPE